jgi:hypothetical protein
MCYVEGASLPKIPHKDEDEARREAERLANLYPGKQVFLLKPVKVCHIEIRPLEWKDL